MGTTFGSTFTSIDAESCRESVPLHSRAISVKRVDGDGDGDGDSGHDDDDEDGGSNRDGNSHIDMMGFERRWRWGWRWLCEFLMLCLMCSDEAVARGKQARHDMVKKYCIECVAALVEKQLLESYDRKFPTIRNKDEL